MKDADSDRQFLRQRDHQEQLVERFDRQLKAYVREHPDADEAEVMAYAELLAAAIPGVNEALGMREAVGVTIAALTADRGDGLPFAGPGTDQDAGSQLWKELGQWTLDDYRLNLAWYREPGAPAAQLAALIAYGETRWPGEDLARQPWPDTSDLPSWRELAPHLAEEEDDDELDRDNPIPPKGDV
jgi:hypothetical protein